jgi:hypothetical protein
MRWLVLVLMLGMAWAQEAYYPSRDGLSWTYNNGETQVLSGVKTVGGYTASVLVKYIEGAPIAEDYMVYDAQGVSMVGTAANGMTLEYTPGLVIYPVSPLQVGQSWKSKANLSGYEITITAEVIGVRGVETAAGRYNALQVRQQTITSTGGQTITDFFFVPSVGVVRWVMQDGTTIDLIDKNF